MTVSSHFASYDSVSQALLTSPTAFGLEFLDPLSAGLVDLSLSTESREVKQVMGQSMGKGSGAG